MPAKFADLDAVIDHDSYEWMLQHAPAFVSAIENAVAKGESPERIRAFVAARVGPDRQALALRCEQTARHLQRKEA